MISTCKGVATIPINPCCDLLFHLAGDCKLSSMMVYSFKRCVMKTVLSAITGMIKAWMPCIQIGVNYCPICFSSALCPFCSRADTLHEDSTKFKLAAVSQGMKARPVLSYTKQKCDALSDDTQAWAAWPLTHIQVLKTSFSMRVPKPPYDAHAELEQSCLVISGQV